MSFQWAKVSVFLPFPFSDVTSDAECPISRLTTQPMFWIFLSFLSFLFKITDHSPMFWIFLHFLSFSFQITDHSADVFIISSLFIFLIPNHRPLGQCFEYFLPLYLYINKKLRSQWFEYFFTFYLSHSKSQTTQPFQKVKQTLRKQQTQI